MFKCLGDFFDSVSLLKFATLRLQLLDVLTCLIIYHDLAQDFSCSVKTVECGQIFILACRQLRKKCQYNFIEQFFFILGIPIHAHGSIFFVIRGTRRIF